MKMFKLFGKRGFATLTALALCASLIAPALAAASFTDLNDAINGTNADHRFYGRVEGSVQGGIEAWTGDDGVRQVVLHEGVEYKNTDGSTSDAKIQNNKEVVLDLNGQTMDNSAFVGSDAANGPKGANSSVIHVRNGSLTIKDSSGNNSGTITGAQQSGIWVDQGTLTLEGGTITGNSNVNGGEYAGGGGVRVSGADSHFIMTGGRITNNSANANGGGVMVYNGASFEMTGGELSGNRSNWGGGVAVIGSNSQFNMSGTALLKDNAVKGDETQPWGNNLPSDIYVKQGGKVTVAIGIETADGQQLDGFKKHEGRDKDGSAETWNGIDVTQSGEITGSTETFLKLEYSQPEPGTPGGGAGGAGEVTIDEPAVPLASGPVTRAEFIDYLWRHENEPDSEGVCTFEDVEATHEYFDALCWADENGVAEAYFNVEGHEDGTFEPDELVTVGAVREFLDNFARVFGMDVDVYALTTLTGDEDEAVLNCDEVLAEFFGEEYIPAMDEDAAA